MTPVDRYDIPDGDAPTTELNLNDYEVLVSVSLKYWHSGAQCISEWQRSELSKLRKLVDKVQGLTATKIRTDPGLSWKSHKGQAARGFPRPASLSKDIDLCELRVDGKARVHGALLDDTFYLVWLDRGHAVFPQR